jgi:hypothetical protein
MEENLRLHLVLVNEFMKVIALIASLGESFGK